MKQKIREGLKTLWHLEVANGTDNFEPVNRLVNQYKEQYGQDDFIDDFVGEYLVDRHNRFYSKNRGKK